MNDWKPGDILVTDCPLVVRFNRWSQSDMSSFYGTIVEGSKLYRAGDEVDYLSGSFRKKLTLTEEQRVVDAGEEE